MTTASILMAGIGSAIIIANRAVGVATSKQATTARTTAGLDRLRSDLAEAYPAASRTASGVTVTLDESHGEIGSTIGALTMSIDIFHRR